MKSNNALIVILGTVTLDAVGIGLVMPVLPGLLRDAGGPAGPERAEPCSDLRPEFRHVTEWKAAAFRHVTYLGERLPTPRRTRSPRAGAGPRTPAGGRSGGSSPGSGRRRIA